VVIWTAVGGRGTLVGPIIGALLVNGTKSFFTAALPNLWLFVLGGLFIFVTVFMPKGIVGTLADLRARGWFARKEANGDAEAAEKNIQPAAAE
jgi:urea transport system permease protein